MDLKIKSASHSIHSVLNQCCSNWILVLHWMTKEVPEQFCFAHKAPLITLYSPELGCIIWTSEVLLMLYRGSCQFCCVLGYTQCKPYVWNRSRKLFPQLLCSLNLRVCSGSSLRGFLERKNPFCLQLGLSGGTARFCSWKVAKLVLLLCNQSLPCFFGRQEMLIGGWDGQCVVWQQGGLSPAGEFQY